ncbi:alkaline phosphatase [Agrobacterium rubi]|uniref:esterase-like activity of phytase family protein n=1 Tax=Agrobacterium rubi TaxID=28099 RepID=UPI00201B859A|nr:esterase-like activity of phytase family protein [Agrobacterium rubi]MCL6651725.1 alkaline phosphatase [Agrobacterium rubi]
MTFRFSSAALTAALCASVAFPAVAEPVFNRIAFFAVALNLPSDKDEKTVTSAEIITASEDGNTLVYSDSPLGGIGFIDIKDAKAPKALGALMMDGEPTSVIASGSKVLAGVNTSESFVKPSGKLVTVDIATKTIEASCELGGQPDSVAVSPDKSFVAIAIENERDEKVNDGALPQMPAGFLVTIGLKDGAADCSTLKKIDVTGLAEISPEDPEPEFVSINTNGEIALTLQENNHIVIIDGKSGKVTNHFSAGTVDLDGIDAKSDGQLKFTDSQKARKREPDAVKWLDNNRIVIANEGDWEGGSRGFTIFDKNGKPVYEAGASLERAVAAIGHYPEKRSKSKGIEPEGLETATFGNDKYFFVLAERASVVGVYKDTGAEPELKQLLPSGISPEGAVAIPSRNLLVTANEADLVEDGGARSHVMIYERAEGQAAYPQLTSATVDGAPIGWGALSGLVGDSDKDGILYAISDSVYGNQPSICTIDATQKPALITSVLRVKRDGMTAQKLDMEGITLDGKGGFWVASEGNSEKLVPHALYNINAKGEIKAEIALPKELLEGETRFGFEGITLIGKGDDATLWMAVQREWGNDEKGTVKLVSYNLKSKEWGAVHYPLDKTKDGWVGLSEITAHGDKVYIVERDNQIGEKAKIKKLYSVAIADLKPGKIGGALPLVKKTETHDFLPDLKAQTNGYVVDKLEGFAFDKSGKAFAVTDNDGVDDSSGETLFFSVDMKATH